MARTNRTIIGGLAALLVLAGVCVTCGTLWLSAGPGDEHYWVRACVTGDETMLIAGGDEAVSVELATGRVLKTVPMYVEAVACGPRGGVAYAASADMVRFPAGERAATDEPTTTNIVGVRDDGSLVHFSRGFDRGGRAIARRAPRNFAMLSVGRPGSLSAGLELVPARFGEVGAARSSGASAFFNVVGDVLPDGRLLLAAGWDGNRSPGYVEPTPWGIYAIDAGTGRVTPLVGTQTCSAHLDTSLLWKVAASPVGTLVAAAFRGGSSTRVAVYDGATLRFDLDIPGAREPTALDFSAAGDRLAVATLSDDGQRAKLTWIDLATGAPIWSSLEVDGTVHFVEHLSDGSLVFMSSRRIVMRVGPDGVPRWRQPA